ncbi:MAG: TIGR02757 family protein [Candidatus Gastranaerophilaceae bacterium]
MITRNELEELTEKYETADFIKDDPIQFPHRFKNSADIEIAAFLASLFAYGSRKVFVKKLEELFEIMQNKPLEFVLNFNPKSLRGFGYRFAKDFDIIEVFNILNKLYKQDSGLKALFEYGYTLNNSILTAFQTVTDYFYANVANKVGQGFYHLIPDPKNGGAMKRMNMFLRWMVRKGPVDLGIWGFIPASELLIPLDVHVARISREMGLLKRSSNDFKAVLELSENLKKMAPQDPAKYDFAMFGPEING